VDYKGVAVQFTKLTPIFGLLTGATVWGLIWYPYRVLEHAGVAGELAATLTYAIAFVFGVTVFRKRLAWEWISLPLAGIGLSAGWANIGFTYAVIYGDVMRVVLLFYLAPVWTVMLARFLLGEKLTGGGYALMALAFSGAVVMLWDPRMSVPVPRDPAEWIGLSAGLMFALSNVLARRHAALAIEAKVLAVFAGGIAVGAASVMLNSAGTARWQAVPAQADLLLLVSIVIFSVNIAVQHGLANVSANRAIVIYLFELVVTAFSAWLLVGETLTLKDACGGAMIIAAGLLSERLAAHPAVPAAHPD
jgi:drug/metabolite transporter (DMT)-like permease